MQSFAVVFLGTSEEVVQLKKQGGSVLSAAGPRGREPPALPGPLPQRQER